MLQFASLNWDTSLEEIFPTLVMGATLVLRTPDMLGSIPNFFGRCRELGITILLPPTAFFHEMALSADAAMLASVPDPSIIERAPITVRKGLASAAVDPPEGCRFVERCPLRIGVCSELTPELVAAQSGQSARCHVTSPSSSIREDTHVESVQ
jgi:oligopeptide/dipeptide ABC transporter ATP-binding protein